MSIESMEPVPTMTDCIEFRGAGGPDVMSFTQRALPELSPGQVLIKVSHAGINRPDVFQREGKYPPPPGASDIPGLEVSGTIVAVGPDVTLWQAGDKVCALLTGGGYARYAIAEELLCLPVPESLTLEEAAAIPETGFTCWYNLVIKGGLTAGQNVLIHGGSSGIGTMGIQLARALKANVYTTAGSDKKCTICEQMGAEKAFNYRTEDFAQVKKLTGGKGMDIVLDMVGGDYVQKNIKCAAPGGRIINIAFLNGSAVHVDLMLVMLKQLVLTGSTLRGKPLAEKAAIAAEVKRGLWPLLESGQVRPVIYKVLPLEKAAEGHKLMESSSHVGKILLDCNG